MNIILWQGDQTSSGTGKILSLRFSIHKKKLKSSLGIQRDDLAQSIFQPAAYITPLIVLCRSISSEAQVCLTRHSIMKQRSWLSCHQTQNPEGQAQQPGWDLTRLRRHGGSGAGKSLFLLQNTCCAHFPWVMVTGTQNNGLCIFTCESSSQKLRLLRRSPDHGWCSRLLPGEKRRPWKQPTLELDPRMLPHSRV